jgi:mRNA interferase MazF
VFEFGSIVLARFPFTDLSGNKRRPAGVVSRDNDRRSDVVVAFVASVQRAGPDMDPIDPSPETGLKAPSVIRFDKVATRNKSIIHGRPGRAPSDWLARHAGTFFGVFGCTR